MKTEPLTEFAHTWASLSSLPRAKARPRAHLCRLGGVLLIALPYLAPLAPEAGAQQTKRVKRAKKVASRMDSAFVEAGRLYTGRKYEQALDAYQKYLRSKAEIKPAVRAMVEQKVALCLAQLGREKEALAKLEQVLAAQKGTPAAGSTQICRGQVLAGMGRAEEAEKAIYAGLMSERVSATFLSQAYGALVEMRLQQNHPQAALPYAKRMYQVSVLRGATAAIDHVCDCYKRIEGALDPSLREFLEYQKFGPLGPDGKPGTGDEVKNPLDKVAVPEEPELVKFAQAAIAKTELLEPTSRGRLWMLAGDYPRALRELMNAYGLASFETGRSKSKGSLRLTQATGDIAGALKAIDGHVHRANQFLRHQRYGPAGEDGKPGTEDDLTNPLHELPAEYWKKHAPADKPLDAAFQAALDKEPTDTVEGHRARGRLYIAWGKPDQALVEMQAAFKLAPGTRRELVRAITDVAVAVKALDVDTVRANQYILFQKHGPKGEDCRPGTEDDLVDPLAGK